MTTKRKDGDASFDSQKKKRVGFATVDPGIKANDCIKTYLVSSPDEIDAESSVHLELVEIDQFFDDDGRIYGYKDLKINIWFSSISFRAYADIKFDSTNDRGKGVTDLKSALQKICGESLVEKKEFVESFSSETHFLRDVFSNGSVIYSDGHDASSTSHTSLDMKDAKTEVIQMNVNNMPVALLYSRLLPLVLLLIEGSSPLDITDPRWEIHFVVKKTLDHSGEVVYTLLGFATIYHFYYYPDSTRLRLSQILVLPPYQGQGYGRCLLESVNSLAISENFYDVTIEEPSDYVQYLRACIDAFRLLNFEPVRLPVASAVSYLKEVNLSKRTKKSLLDPPADIVEGVREKLKINKKQFLKCWEVLIFMELDTTNTKCMENFKICVADRVKGDILDKDAGTGGKRLVEIPSSYEQEMSFAVFKTDSSDGTADNTDAVSEEDRSSQEEQLNQLVDERIEEISSVAQKVATFPKSTS